MKKLVCSALILSIGFAAARGGQQQQTQQTTAAPTATVDNSRQTVEETPQAGKAVDPNRRQQMSEEEAAVLPYYNNFLSTYRLGPEDMISVSVFGLERYSKPNITVPPNGVIAYPLIPEGVKVVGKTTGELQEELREKLEEYIIDPKVTVTLEQARSARYSVLGDVRAPGVKPMLRRLTAYEAISEAGGVLDTGSKKKVVVLRRQADGEMKLIPVNISKIEKGDAADLVYLVPGDQILVPGNTLKKVREVAGLVQVVSFARFFRFFF